MTRDRSIKVRRHPGWFTRMVYNFTIRDLEMNRRGMLSRRQRRRLWLKAERERFVVWMVAGAILTGIFTWTMDVTETFLQPISLVFVLAALLLSMTVIYVFYPAELRRDIEAERVRMAAGMVQYYGRER